MARLAVASLLWGLLMMGASCAQPSGAAPATITVENAWIAAPLGATDTVSGFVTIRNAGTRADRLVSASSARAAGVMLHDMRMNGAVMTMRSLDSGLAVPARGSVSLSPGGAHLMIMGVEGPLPVGATVPVVLQFDRAGAVTIDFRVSDHPPMAHH